jgi:hypothetical protein
MLGQGLRAAQGREGAKGWSVDSPMDAATQGYSTAAHESMNSRAMCF